MTDYIDRQAAIEAVGLNTWAGSRLAQIPHAEVEPVKRGKWKTAYLDHEAFGERPKVLYCSECNYCASYATRYCPNCGARMEKDDETN